MSSKAKVVEAVNAYKAIYAVADAEGRQLTSAEAKAVEKHLAIAQRYQGTAAAEEFLRQPAHIYYCHGRPYGRRRLVYTIIRTVVRMKSKEREHPRDSLSQSTSEPQEARGATRPPASASGHHALWVSGGSPRVLRAATAARASSIASLRASSGVSVAGVVAAGLPQEVVFA
jgi:hypothetical protein